MNRYRLFRLWFYFRRGYSNYLALAVGFVNFVTIQYYLLVQRVEFLGWLFPRLLAFALAAAPSLLLLATLLGWLDAKRGAIRTEVSIVAEQNPVLQDIAARLERIERLLKQRSGNA